VEGRLAVGASLPTERELAARYGVSRITVRHALRDLELAGLVRRSRPTGNVVASNRARPANAWSFESLQDIVAFGEQTQVRILSFAQRRAPQAIAATFRTSGQDRLACVHGLRLLGKQPLSEFFFWMTPAVASQLTPADLLQPTLFSVIETRLAIRLVEARQTVWCESAGKRLSKLLRTRATAPVLAIQRLYIAEGGLPVEVAISRFEGRRYRLKHVLTRSPLPT